MKEDELLKKYNRLYLEIIMRYKDTIEKGEKLYVAELPKLITPEDEAVVSLVKSITSAFPSYSSEADFYDAVRQAHKYVKDSITTVTPPMEFWLKPAQAVEIEAGDIFDKAVLLCSMMIAMGNVTTKIMAVVSEDKKRFTVYCEFKGKILSVDVENDISEFQNREELMANMGVRANADITAYEFNDKMYNDLA